ncbi:hypothetical protein BXZ70DRAFT_1007053 [Cristinia sonorae]|uniref:Uncharacterized protein n=1 Tax=Cristinia sonorae TaxID=1940300 RepID=A0A8K0UQJ1_9AGAR|nr:hypothetical protein BXZ70DRAFT_1007053 [Cristinia sonorae]
MAPGITPLVSGTDSPSQADHEAADPLAVALPLVIGAIALIIVFVIGYILYRSFRSKERVQPSLRKLRLPELVEEKTERSKGLVLYVRNFFNKSTTISIVADNTPEPKDIEAQNCVPSPPSEKANHGSSDDGLAYLPDAIAPSASTPSLCNSSSPEIDSPPIPESWAGFDNILSTPLDDLDTLDSDSEYIEEESAIVDVLNQFPTTPAEGPVSSPNLVVGLGLTNFDIPVILLESCETRAEAPLDVNFVHDTPQSPIIVSQSPDIKYLTVPPPQYYADQREEAEEAAKARDHSHYLLTRESIAFITASKKSIPGVRPFLTRVDLHAAAEFLQR